MKDQGLIHDLQGKSQKEAFQILQQKGVLNPELTLCEAVDMGLSVRDVPENHSFCLLMCW
ncbi:hypothetical protein [Bacillus thuringiensis]|uniref:hypothetical protein n=1 Tax=Bacillus cereus group TaxID=86661 RepID=UPI00077E349B|nr:hypothetical protein [Bacillus thuringiensis]AMR06559.1 hypothetical protein AXW78_30035 [Bacillus thuringiensis]PNK26885.1 hypothetical protein CBR55_31685 [Bacillus thuringiensis]